MQGKKVICGVLAAAVWTSSLLAVSAQAQFNDIGESHWAYSAVNELVNDGTVRGYEDGGFHPDGTVTRAEFVKMIGKGSVVRTENYSDVPADHWGYEYIMASGLQTEGNAFLPDVPIKRGEVLDLIWSRNGSQTGVTAPAAITGQWQNKDAVAWGYTYGIMIGNDGYQLRLNDPLTRAEAAALIIRGRNYASATPIDFANTVSEDLLKIMIKSSGLIDGDVDNLAQNISNGQLAMAALRLLYGEDNPMLASYPNGVSDCAFGKQWGVVASSYLNTTDYSEAMVQKNALLSDGVAALSMAAIGKAKGDQSIKISPDGYKNYAADGKVKMGLSVAKGCGVEFYADGSLDGSREMTLKDLGIILLQLDSAVGLKRSYVDTTPKDEKIQKDLQKYPANFAAYPVILEAVPASVYEVPYLADYVTDYDMAREFYMAFTNALSRLSQKFSTNNYRLKFTYYPSLVKKDEKGYYVMRVYMTKQGTFDGVTYKDIFGEQFGGADAPAKDGFIEIKTTTPLDNIVYPAENLVVTQVID